MPRVEKYAFWRGLQSTLPNDIISGRILHCYDTGNVYLDYKDYLIDGELKRVQLTDTGKLSLSGNPVDGDGEYIPMSGPIILYGEPTDSRGAVPKSYVDALDDRFTTHDTDSVRHITDEERVSWNGKVDEVVYEPIQYEGVKLGTITIDGDDFTVYAPAVENIEGNAETATKLQNARYIDGVKFDGSRDIIHYVQCDTLGEDPEKKVEITNFKLSNGSEFTVLFPYDNTASDITLQVNDEDPYPIQYHRQPIDETTLSAGVYKIVFTGIVFEIVGIPKILTATEDADGLMSAEDKRIVNRVPSQIQTINTDITAIQTTLAGIEQGTISVTIPEATTDTLGGVYVGPNINVSNGIISIDSSSVIGALGFEPANKSEAGADVFIPCTPTSDGAQGLVPGPAAGDHTSFLRGDGEWADIPSARPFKGAIKPSIDPVSGEPLPGSDGESGLVPEPRIEDADKFLKGDGTWATAAGEVDSITDEEIDEICVVPASLGGGASGSAGSASAITAASIAAICVPAITTSDTGNVITG